MPVACTEVLLLSSILQRRIEVGEDVCGTPEVCGGDLAKVDGMVPGLHLADHAAFQVGECLVEEWGPRLSRGVWRAGERSVLRLEGFGELTGQVYLLGIEEIQGKDTALFDKVVRVLVLTDGDHDLLRLEGDLRDPAGGEPIGLAVRAYDAGNVEAVRDGLEDLTAHLLVHSLLPLRNSSRSNRASLSQMAFYMSAFQQVSISALCFRSWSHARFAVGRYLCRSLWRRYCFL